MCSRKPSFRTNISPPFVLITGEYHNHIRGLVEKGSEGVFEDGFIPDFKELFGYFGTHPVANTSGNDDNS